MNKLEITDVMICEWDAETKCIIVSPAEGWKVNVNYPISEAHASMVTMEKMAPDYSHLIGKWLRCTNHPCPIGPGSFKVGSWYEMNQNPYPRSISAIDDNGDPWFGLSPSCFDLTDPRDYNPDEEPQLQPTRVIQKGTRVRNLKETKWVKKGATGTADETSVIPYVIWDSPDMLTEERQSDNRTLARVSEHILELPADPKPEPKPHQLQEYDAVECTPEERAEIIRIADECGVPMHISGVENPDKYPFLGFSESKQIVGLTDRAFKYSAPYIMNSVPDFIAKIRGEYTENKVNVTEYKHESV